MTVWPRRRQVAGVGPGFKVGGGRDGIDAGDGQMRQVDIPQPQPVPIATVAATPEVPPVPARPPGYPSSSPSPPHELPPQVRVMLRRAQSRATEKYGVGGRVKTLGPPKPITMPTLKIR